jgi:hypothetical protein
MLSTSNKNTSDAIPIFGREHLSLVDISTSRAPFLLPLCLSQTHTRPRPPLPRYNHLRRQYGVLQNFRSHLISSPSWRMPLVFRRPSPHKPHQTPQRISLHRIRIRFDVRLLRPQLFLIIQVTRNPFLGFCSMSYPLDVFFMTSNNPIIPPLFCLMHQATTFSLVVGFLYPCIPHSNLN